MRKICLTIILCLCAITLFFSSSCEKSNKTDNESNDNTPPNSENKVYFECSIKFSRTIIGETVDLYTDGYLPINTDIYVLVDFVFYNLDSVNDVIDFKVNLKPGFDTYSVHDYTKGPQEPTIPDHEENLIDEDGIKKVIEISGMKFNIKSENAKKKYSYVFTIKASKVSEDCEFKTIFSPQDGLFNDGRNKSFSEKFSLIETEKGDENNE